MSTALIRYGTKTAELFPATRDGFLLGKLSLWEWRFYSLHPRPQGHTGRRPDSQARGGVNTGLTVVQLSHLSQRACPQRENDMRPADRGKRPQRQSRIAGLHEIVPAHCHRCINPRAPRLVIRRPNRAPCQPPVRSNRLGILPMTIHLLSIRY